jgi:hypothetical protein
MFSKEELAIFNIPYFEIVSDIEDRAADTLIEIKSKNTGHYWRLHKKKNIPKGKRTVVIYHKHNITDEYHRHYEAYRIIQAICSIMEHDTYVMSGSKPTISDKKRHGHGIIYS